MAEARIRLKHATKVGGREVPAGSEIAAPRERALRLVAKGRADLVEDGGADRMVRETSHGPAWPVVPHGYPEDPEE